MRFTVISVILLLSGLLQLAGQDKKTFKAQFLEGEYFFIIGEYSEARFIYSELLKEDPTNANLNFLIGACYLSNYGEKSKSIEYLEKASASVSPGYREGSYKERNAPVQCFFALAKAYHIANRFDDARVFYQKYLDAMSMKDPAEMEFVAKQLEACKLAEYMIKHPLPYTRTAFSPEVNVYASNSNAVISEGADSMMIFMREKPFYTAIMMTRLEKGSWTKPTVINDQLGVGDKCNLCSISADGKELYLSLEEDNQIYDLYVSYFKKGKWSKIEKLNDNINTHYSETHASVSSDGKSLYFTSDKPGGVGAMDIYVSQIDDNGDWGPAVNLGKPVNSVYSEETPFISEDGKTLFFSSMGHATMGGFDVFFSSKLPNGKWSAPANMGYPISTADDDLFYFPIGPGRQALYSGFMDQEERKQKIYMVNLDTSSKFENIALKGVIKLEDKVQELDESFKIKITNSNKKDTVITITPDAKTGEFTADLKPGNYEVSTEGNGYTQTKENITINPDISRNEIRLETGMTPKEVSSGEYLIIQNVLFGFDDYKLSEKAKSDIEKLYQAMVSHPQIYVQVIGHADAKGSDEYNLKLSAKRSRSVIDYLVSKGISSDRFISLALGEQESIALNENPDGSDNPEGRRLNRYAEIKLLNNSDENIKIAPIDVPVSLRPRADESYTILLKQTTDTSYVPEPVADLKILLTETDKARLFMSEEFKSKAKAIEELNTIIDNGFPDARILNRSEKDYLIASLTDRNDDRNGPFTIQILALRNPVDLSRFGKLNEVSEYTGKDGYYRYITGVYNSKEEARIYLSANLASLYPDAFVVPLERYSDMHDSISRTVTGKIYYTIQFSATRKPAPKNKYKNLGNIHTSFGKDGFYRYSSGLYNNQLEAEIELDRIKSLGFSDAFLKKLIK